MLPELHSKFTLAHEFVFLVLSETKLVVSSFLHCCYIFLLARCRCLFYFSQLSDPPRCISPITAIMPVILRNPQSVTADSIHEHAYPCNHSPSYGADIS